VLAALVFVDEFDAASVVPAGRLDLVSDLNLYGEVFGGPRSRTVSPSMGTTPLVFGWRREAPDFLEAHIFVTGGSVFGITRASRGDDAECAATLLDGRRPAVVALGAAMPHSQTIRTLPKPGSHLFLKPIGSGARARLTNSGSIRGVRPRWRRTLPWIGIRSSSADR
jgi:hypothetical protein